VKRCSHYVPHGPGLEQKSIVAELGLDDVHLFSTRQQSRDLQLLAERVETITGNAGDGDAGTHRAERDGDATAPATDVVMVHRLTEDNVAVRVESSRQFFALVLEV